MVPNVYVVGWSMDGVTFTACGVYGSIAAMAREYPFFKDSPLADGSYQWGEGGQVFRAEPMPYRA